MGEWGARSRGPVPGWVSAVDGPGDAGPSASFAFRGDGRAPADARADARARAYSRERSPDQGKATFADERTDPALGRAPEPGLMGLVMGVVMENMDMGLTIFAVIGVFSVFSMFMSVFSWLLRGSSQTILIQIPEGPVQKIAGGPTATAAAALST